MASYEATVADIEDLAPSIRQLTVSMRDPRFRFQPGQWVNVRFPEGVSRAYTIASAPQRPQAVQLCIRVGSGPGGTALRRLEAGATLRVEGPHGDFLLPPDDGRGVALLAGDVGIAPIRSIVLHMITVSDPRRPLVLYEPDQRYILYAGDFDPLTRAGQILHMSGSIETLMDRNRAALAGAVIMAAGFDTFLKRARAALEKIDVDPSDMITESFGPQP
jgi:ferredoxin-NADP reductase